MGQATQLGIGKIEEHETVEVTARSSLPPRNQKRAKSWKKILLLSVAAVVLIGLVVGGIVWSRRGVVTVQTGKVVKEDIAATVSASGQIEPPPDKLANVNANSFGKITAIYVKEGDRVKQGQLLLRTEDVQQTANVDAQEAAVKTSQADFAANESAVQSAAAALKTAQANLAQAQAKLQQAKEEYTRGEQLFKDNLIARNVFDQRLSDYHVAEASVQSAEAQVNQSKALNQQALYNRDMAKARISQSRAQLLGMKDAYQKTIYTSPFDGVVTSLPVHAGENVVPGIQNQPGSVLFQVSDLTIATAQIMVDETDIINVKLGQPADLTIDAMPNQTFKAHVTEIGQSAVNRDTGQTTTTAAGTQSESAKDFKVVVTLDSPPAGLHPGLSTTAKITTVTKQNAVTIPIQALAVRTRRELEQSEKAGGKSKALAADPQPASQKEKDKGKEELQGVFVVQGGVAKFVQVKTGIMGATDVEVLDGVQPGDEIVTGSYQVLRTLKNHSKVKVNNSPLGPGNGPGPSAS